MEPITLLTGVVIGVAGKWLYDNQWKLPNRHESNVTVAKTPPVQTTPAAPQPETPSVPGTTGTA